MWIKEECLRASLKLALGNAQGNREVLRNERRGGGHSMIFERDAQAGAYFRAKHFPRYNRKNEVFIVT